MKQARVLLTGGSGFVGSRILKRLLEIEGLTVHTANRSGPPSEALAQGAIWHRANLLDPSDASELIFRIEPTHILHCAWIVTPGIFWTDETNKQWADSSIAMIKAARTLGGTRFVGVGTCAEYDWNSADYIENVTPEAATTPYSEAKLRVCHALMDTEGLSAAWGRIFFPYGPGDALERLLGTVQSALSRGEKVALTSGKHVRDFTHVTDIADFFVTLLFSDQVGLFNCGTGRGTSVRSAVEKLADIMGRNHLLQFGAKPDREEPLSLVADMTRANHLLGWRHSIPIEAGIRTLTRNAR